MAFSRALVWSEMQTALPKIRTKIDDFIFYDNNYYTKHDIILATYGFKSN